MRCTLSGLISDFGCPLVWVCGYRCGTLACGWMSTTHAWWPKSVGMLIAEATTDRRVDGRGGLGGGGEAEDGG